MSGRNAISELQELMAARALPLPKYTQEMSGSSFKCTVEAAGVIGVGYSSATKKTAKHESARIALEKFKDRRSNSPQIIMLGNAPPLGEKATKNYVGDLNEYSSKQGFNYPKYEECVAHVNAGRFFTKCSFLGNEVLGSGLNKKDAKQDAAKKMLELFKSADITKLMNNDVYKVMQMQPKNSVIVNNTEEIISLYKNLAVNDAKIAVANNNHLQSAPEMNLSVQDDSVEGLEAKLRSYGVKYTMARLQHNPCIMYARIRDTNLFFCSAGVNQEEATRNVLRDIVEAKKSGCSLSTDDLISFE